MFGQQVVVAQTNAPCYPRIPPFHPGSAYPEYEFGELAAEPNEVYELVRHALILAGLDAKRAGTPRWNPLGRLIRPGETVLLKPNLIKEFHPRDPLGWQYVMTHGSVVRAVADYVFKALAGHGTVIIADAPQTDSSFYAIVQVLGLDVIRDFYRARGLDIELVDLRLEEWRNRGGVIVGRRRLPGDPRGAVAIDLGPGSAFHGHGGAGRYYGADYDQGEVNAHHSGGRHEYLLAGSAIRADVVFSLPKLKTHKKAGITVSLKNLVGITADKNWLPHHTEGSPEDGGMSTRDRTSSTVASAFSLLDCDGSPSGFRGQAAGSLCSPGGWAAWCMATRSRSSAAGIGGATTRSGGCAWT